MTNFSSCVDLKIFRHGLPAAWTYQDLDQFQREFCDETRDTSASGLFILSEVAPVITLGSRTPASDILMGTDLLKEKGIELYFSDRGGLATYHGPGQWVFFAVGSLEFWTGDRRGVKRMMEGLLESALLVSKKIDPTAQIRRGAELGVWTSKGKVASVGIHVEKGMVLHGLSLNCFRTPTSFLGIRPCGLDSAVDFLLDDLRGTPSAKDGWFLELGRNLVLAASKQFDCRVNLQSLSLTNKEQFSYTSFSENKGVGSPAPTLKDFDHYVGV